MVSSVSFSVVRVVSLTAVLLRRSRSRRLEFPRDVHADVVQIQKSGDLFRLLYNTKGRFVLHRVLEEEAKFKLCRVTKVPANLLVPSCCSAVVMEESWWFGVIENRREKSWGCSWV